MSNVLSDIWSGITQGISQKVSAAEARITANTGVQPTSGNTGAYFGMSIVDWLSGKISGASKAIQQAAVNSGTGQKLISTATQSQIAKLVGDWRTWAILIGAILLFVFIGRASKSGK